MCYNLYSYDRKGDHMKKIILFLVLLFVSTNVYALSAANIELYVNKPDGVEVNDNIIPNQSAVTLLDEYEGKDEALVQYNGESITIKKEYLKLKDEILTSEHGHKLDKEETAKVFVNAGLEIYNGPSKNLYKRANKVIPALTEITYSYIDNEENTDNKYVYVTYDGVSGWVLLNIIDEEVAIKENGKIMIINPDNIELKDDIYGNKVDNTIEENTILEYEYYTKYQYNVKYQNNSLWLSINGDEALAHEATASITVNELDKVYEKPNLLKHIYEFEATETIKPLFYYNDFYYIEYNDIKGWVKLDSVTESSTKIDPIKKTDVVETIGEPVVPEKKQGIKPEIIVIVFLGVLLLVSLTSLIGVMIMNKKNPLLPVENTDNTTNSDNNNEKNN